MPTALVPAAGRSRRMGQPKLWLPYRDGSVLGAVLESLVAAGCDPLVVVVRRGQKLPPDAARLPELETAVNPQPERGMLSSILAGLEALGGADAVAGRGEALVICPGDHPAIRPATVRLLLAASTPSSAVVPLHGGRRGHPLVLGADLVLELPSLDPRIGLRQLLTRKPRAVRELAVDDPGVRIDLDRPEDYERLAAGR